MVYYGDPAIGNSTVQGSLVDMGHYGNLSDWFTGTSAQCTETWAKKPVTVGDLPKEMLQVR